MDTSWDTFTPKGLRNAKIFSTVFIVVSILIFIFLSESIGKILILIGVIFGLGPFVLGSKGAIKNKVYVLKMVEPGYHDWKDEEIEKQVQAIEECGYKWFEQKGRVAFKHTKTGLYLKMKGLHFYSPEEIKTTYKDIWSKTDPEQVKRRDTIDQKLAEAISSGTTNEEIESIIMEHQKK